MNAKYLEISGRTFYAFEEPDFIGPRLKPMFHHPDEITLPSVEKYVAIKKGGFWRRQFDGRVTSGQRTFDWVFGVTLPVICVFFDPVVFNSTMHEPALLGAYKSGAYLLSFIAVITTMAWLLWGAKLKWLNAILSGLFAASDVTA